MSSIMDKEEFLKNALTFLKEVGGFSTWEPKKSNPLYEDLLKADPEYCLELLPYFFRFPQSTPFLIQDIFKNNGLDLSSDKLNRHIKRDYGFEATPNTITEEEFLDIFKAFMQFEIWYSKNKANLFYQVSEKEYVGRIPERVHLNPHD